MNCYLGSSNGSVDNVIVDDENTTVIQISLCVNRDSYYDIQVIANTRDLIQFNSQYYGFTRVIFPNSEFIKTVGWQSYDIIKFESMVQFKFNFYDINTLLHWMGGKGTLDSKTARRIFARFFPSASLQDPVYEPVKKIWKCEIIQISDLYANMAFNLKAIKELQKDMTAAKDAIGSLNLLIALLSEQVTNIERSYISTQEAVKNLQYFIQKTTYACATGGTFEEYDPTILIEPKPPKKEKLIQQIYNIQIGLNQLKNTLTEEQTVVFKKHCKSNIFKF